MLPRQSHAIIDMADNHCSAYLSRIMIVRIIHHDLILNKEVRAHQLADIVIVCASSN